MTYVAKEKERLDVIVWEHYESLEMFERVLVRNIHIVKSLMLVEQGDVVFLPDSGANVIEAKIIKGATLW